MSDNIDINDLDQENAETYYVTNVLYTHNPLKTVPDLETGGERNRRWGAIASFGILPGLDESPLGPAVLPIPPTQFFTADDLDALRDKVVSELDRAIGLAKLAKENPEEFQRRQMELSKSLAKST